MAEKSNGDCYLCGKNLSKTAMKDHLLKNHNNEKEGQDCCLLMIEGSYNKNYRLYIDVPLEKTLKAVDSFLRKIWLECCGHLSEFQDKNDNTIKTSLKIKELEAKDQFLHIYDFGSSTETDITVIGNVKRKPQKGIVRLLARNSPAVYKCAKCGKEADYICVECQNESNNPYYCYNCSERHKCAEEMLLPIANSPRMGECGYTGEFDTFDFDPNLWEGM